jgi:hypothetical protein
MSATARDVLNGSERWSCEQGDCLPWLKQLPDRAVSLVFFSPPYEDARTYGIGFKHKAQGWVDWLRLIIVECCRVSSGLVCVNMSAKVEGGSYSAAVEWLVADLTRLDGVVCGPSPYSWVKSEDFDDAPGNGTPGSGGPRYQRRDWEPIYTFCLPDRLPLAWSDNTAFGRPPKYQAGGAPSHRRKDGTRAHERGPEPSRRSNGDMKRVNRGLIGDKKIDGGRRTGTKIRTIAHQNFGGEDGMVKGGHAREIVAPPIPEPFMGYDPPPISNPGNVLSDAIMAADVLRVPVGGGKLGCPIAHEGEAPMALGVAERFVCWFAPPESIVLDPFTGTGTTAHASLVHGRRFIGIDLRESQVELTTKRMARIQPGLFA